MFNCFKCNKGINKKFIYTFILITIILILFLNSKMFKLKEYNNNLSDNETKDISKNQKSVIDEVTISKKELQAKNDPSTLRY